jgi:hypothetical protein
MPLPSRCTEELFLTGAGGTSPRASFSEGIYTRFIVNFMGRLGKCFAGRSFHAINSKRDLIGEGGGCGTVHPVAIGWLLMFWQVFRLFDYVKL